MHLSAAHAEGLTTTPWHHDHRSRRPRGRRLHQVLSAKAEVSCPTVVALQVCVIQSGRWWSHHGTYLMSRAHACTLRGAACRGGRHHVLRCSCRGVGSRWPARSSASRFRAWARMPSAELVWLLCCAGLAVRPGRRRTAPPVRAPAGGSATRPPPGSPGPRSWACGWSSVRERAPVAGQRRLALQWCGRLRGRFGGRRGGAGLHGSGARTRRVRTPLGRQPTTPPGITLRKARVCRVRVPSCAKPSSNRDRSPPTCTHPRETHTRDRSHRLWSRSSEKQP